MGIVVSGATPGYLGSSGQWAKDRLGVWAASHGWGFHWGAEFDSSRPPSWSKIRFLQALAPLCVRLLWVDADVIATLSGPPPDEVFAGGGGATVFAARDENGLNCGVMGLEGAGVGAFLEWVWGQEQFVHHQWWEQAAIHRHYEFHQTDFRIIPKRIWNAYPGEEGPDTALIHFPGHHRPHFERYAGG